MKRLLITIPLICALYSSAFAGEIPSVGAPAPAPRGTAETVTTAPGQIPTVDAAEQFSSDALSALLAAFGLLTV